MYAKILDIRLRSRMKSMVMEVQGGSKVGGAVSVRFLSSGS